MVLVKRCLAVDRLCLCAIRIFILAVQWIKDWMAISYFFLLVVILDLTDVRALTCAQGQLLRLKILSSQVKVQIRLLLLCILIKRDGLFAFCRECDGSVVS